jgi:hypothetical protein
LKSNVEGDIEPVPQKVRKGTTRDVATLFGPSGKLCVGGDIGVKDGQRIHDWE